jgi:ParB family transcriptional regulator, chromosome partitioning protein
MALNDNTLGRGIADVLAKTVRREPPKGFLEVDLGLVLPPKDNPRQVFDQAAIDDLAASITLHGIMQPIVVMRRDVGYEIVSGERRYRAAKQAGLAKVPVVIRDEDTPQHLAELRLIENIQREDLNPLDLATAYHDLLTTHGLTHDDLAGRLGKNRSVISNTLRILTLPENLRPHLQSGAISLGHAKALLGATDLAWMQQLAQRILDDGLSVRETERLAKAGPPAIAPTPVTGTSETPPHIKELEHNLKLLFGTTVKVKEKAGGKGTMTVHFHSRDHFQRMISLMAKIMDQEPRAGGASAARPAPAPPR